MQAKSTAHPEAGRLVSGPWRLTIDHLWLSVPVFVLLWKSFIFPLPLVDFWWHLKMGQIIATTRSIPRVDLFSFTASGRPFVVQNWLAELIFYWTYLLGGFSLIVFANALMALAALILVYRLCLAAAGRLRIAVLLAFLAAVGNYTLVRPQAFSFLLFAAFYYVLTRFRERRGNLLWSLPPLMALWVNLHGAFVLGLGLIAVFIACESCRRFMAPARTDALRSDEIRKLAVVLIACGAATLLNPETYKVYDYIRTVVSDPASQQYVAEWQPPRVNQAVGILLFFVPFFSGVLIFTFARVKPDLTEAVLFFGFAIFGMTATRNAAWFTTVAYPILARYLPQLDLDGLSGMRRFRVVERLFRWSETRSGDSAGDVRFNALLAGIGFLVLAAQSPWSKTALLNKSLLDEQTPVGAVNFIEDHRLAGRIFHPQIFGDYIIWRLWPGQKSFIDGRVHLFDLDFVRRNFRVLYDSHWEELLQVWDIRYLLLSKAPGDEGTQHAINACRDSRQWKKLYEDEISILFEKLE